MMCKSVEKLQFTQYAYLHPGRHHPMSAVFTVKCRGMARKQIHGAVKIELGPAPISATLV